jgi:hypothetical protein
MSKINLELFIMNQYLRFLFIEMVNILPTILMSLRDTYTFS